ncbi:MAG TPA: response regulator, partial [Saprospiraceae bacterium]|nr:response regulator [Saprospiraceae bacterium]
MKNDKHVIVMVADDDEDDRLMTKEAFQESGLANKVLFVQDGVELMDYLNRRGKYADPDASPRPGLILLDLNMPRMDGHEALRLLKSDNSLRSIPVTIFTTSKAQEDIVRTYGLGSNCFITKPVTFSGLVDTIRQLGSFWFDLVEIPTYSRRGVRMNGKEKKVITL